MAGSVSLETRSEHVWANLHKTNMAADETCDPYRGTHNVPGTMNSSRDRGRRACQNKVELYDLLQSDLGNALLFCLMLAFYWVCCQVNYLLDQVYIKCM